MKPFFVIFIFLASHVLAYSQTSQQINNTNYYSFQKNEGSINWLRACDATPIIIDELLKNGIPYYTISIGDLMKVNKSTHFVVTVTFGKGDSTYGFLYEAIHGIPLEVSDRDFLTHPEKADYTQTETDTLGKDVHYMRIFQLPSNIFLLKERCYWFQFDSNGTNYPVSKEVAQNILRQDIRNYLRKL